MAYCSACEDLKDYAPDFLINGVTDKTCNSLRKNTGVNSDLKVLHKNCEDLNDILNCLIGAHADVLPSVDICELKKWLTDLMENIKTFDKAMLCSHCGQWEEIEKIKTDIKNIRKWLEGLSGVYTWLTRGIDYELEFYNGYYTTANDVHIGVVDTGSMVMVRAYGFPANGTILYNDNLQGTDMRHSQTLEQKPLSRIYSIKFLGNYAYLNNYNLQADETTPTGVWNLSPSTFTNRASWAGVITPNASTGPHPIVMTITSYADGWNSTWAVYEENPLIAHHINHTVNFELLKP